MFQRKLVSKCSSVGNWGSVEKDTTQIDNTTRYNTEKIQAHKVKCSKL
jgi:hypothetical protein